MGSGHLAIVGGGPSIEHHIDELRDWTGDVWAINGAWNWCRDKGISAMFYSADPGPVVAEMCKDAEAVLAAHCDPAAFAAARRAYRADWPVAGPTSAIAGARFAIEAGYEHITFFGCESCFDGDSHAYGNKDLKGQITIRTLHRVFNTNLVLMSQAEYLAGIIQAAPNVFSERSGGLLGAMAKHNEWELVEATPDVYEAIEAAA